MGKRWFRRISGSLIRTARPFDWNCVVLRERLGLLTHVCRYVILPDIKKKRLLSYFNGLLCDILIFSKFVRKQNNV